MADIKVVAVVHYDKDGCPTFHVFGDGGVRLFIVDDRAPGDRVYEVTSRRDPSELRDVIGSDPIGHAGDERHEALSNRLIKGLFGKRHLEVVDE